MSPKVFLGLLVVTVITSAAAAVTVIREPAATAVHYGSEPAFPALRANPDAVAKIVITTADGKFTLVRETGDRWSAAERFGYTVDGKRVRDLIVSLADMRLVEAKTRMPDRYGRIEVEDVTARGAKSRLVRLESADGKVLAEALIGKEHYQLTGNQSAGTYLRRPGEAQSWLASGDVRIEPKVVDWLDKEVVNLESDTVRRVEIRPASGPAYVAERTSPGGPLALQNLAAGETAKKPDDLKRLATAFTSISFDDVKRRSDLKWPSEHDTAVATTFDGVELTVQLAKIDGKPWAIFDARQIETPASASAANSASMEQTAAAKPGKTTDTAAASGTGTAAAATTQASDKPGTTAEGKSAGAKKLTADEINQRVGEWAYQIPSYVFDRMTKPRSEWLEKSSTS
jgi:hypothetical protein